MSELTLTTIAYFADGAVRVKVGTATPRTLESQYGNSIREKAIRTQQKNSWKGAGVGSSPFSGGVLWGKAAMAQDVPVAITSICVGREQGGLIYSLESGSLCALLEAGQLGVEERRLWNDNRMRLRHLAVSPKTGDIAFAVLHQNGTANIGMKINGESGVRELTEGDSFDTAPEWMPGEEQKVVFQSAGIGRNREGHYIALGPFCIQVMDVTTGAMETLVEDSKYDFLAPQFQEDGTLYYIRRPYSSSERLQPLSVLKDAALFPWRLLVALFHFLNFFSALFSGRQLTSATGAQAKRMNMRQMMIWGNIVQAQKQKRPEDEGIDLVPKSWELYKRGADGQTTAMASGVLAYDISRNGTIVYTNGNALFLLHPDGRKERVLTEPLIEQVFFLP